MARELSDERGSRVRGSTTAEAGNVQEEHVENA
jgi:hypothetical protein